MGVTWLCCGSCDRPEKRREDHLVGLQRAMKKSPSCLGHIGDYTYTTQLHGDSFINHEIRILIEEPG